MARLIYALQALAAVALVAGFLISTSNIPLFASIALTAIVSVLILYGNSRRLRQGGELFDSADEPAEEMEEIVEVDEADLAVEFGKPSRRDAAATGKMPAVVANDTTRIVTPKSKPKSAPTPKSKSTPKSKPTPEKKTPRTTATRRPRAATTTPSSHVRVVPGRAKYHRSTCRFAQNDDARDVTEATAKRRGYVACSVCFKDQPGVA